MFLVYLALLIMSFQYQVPEEAHEQVLKTTLKIWATTDHDVYLVSKEGYKIFTQKTFLGFYSRFLTSIISIIPSSQIVPGISVEASANSIARLLNILETGEATFENKEDLENVVEVAQEMGIDIKCCSIENKDNLLKCKNYESKLIAENIASMLLENPEVLEHSEPGFSHLTEYHCNICDKPFLKKKYLQKHKLRTHKERIVKQIATVYNRHLSEEASIIEPLIETPMEIARFEENENKSIECIICKDEPLSLSEPEDHICIFKCVDCSKIYETARKLTEHMRLHTKEFQCDICEKSFRKGSHLKRHKNSNIHQTLSPFKCDICDKEFTQNAHLKRHQQSHNSDVFNEERVTSEISNLMFCESCSLEFDRVDEFISHSAMFHNLNKFVAPNK